MKNIIETKSLDRPVRKMIDRMLEALAFVDQSRFSPAAKQKIHGLIDEIASVIAKEVRS